MIKFLLPCCASLSLFMTAPVWGQTGTQLHLDAGKITARVSPTFFGQMTEEINHSYDGGLYAELIQNRIFMNSATAPVDWSVVQTGAGTAVISLDNSQPIPGTVLTTCLKLEAGHASNESPVGLANDGFWGIPVKPQTIYRASFYVRTDQAGPLTLSLESQDGASIFATAQVTSIPGPWRKYTATLITGSDAPRSTANRFVITARQPGTYWFNLISLFPPTYHDRPNGNRIDLMQLLIGMNPAILRLPGGNFLEGGSIATRFDWEKTVGPLEQRPGHPGCWGYRASDGLGLLEFLEWCEDMHAQPVLAVYAGYSLDHEHVSTGADLQPFLDSALNEIEYVTGDVTTKWGAQRAKDGHPEPFPLTYVEIGNEDQFDGSHSYDGRFAQFYDAIRAKYPSLQLIATTRVTSRTPDVYDDHFYRNPMDMESDAAHYDSTDRHGPKVFVGEWATRSGGWHKNTGSPTPTLEEALSDAAWLTGLERNSDVVVMQCYAPLLTRVEPQARQWEPDLIGYDSLTSFGSPSYYAQKMFSDHIGDAVIALTVDHVPTTAWQQTAPKNQPAPPPRQVSTLFFAATKDSAKGTLYLKAVNTAATAQAVRIDITGAPDLASDGTAITLTSASLHDVNSIAEPTKIAPVTSKISGLGSQFNYSFAPYSVTVLVLPAR
jgi:alpha-N-arabinofuranosidase